MDPLIEALLHSRKEGRWELVRSALQDASIRNDGDRIAQILERVSQLGRKWKTGLAKALADGLAEEAFGSASTMIERFLDEGATWELVVHERDSGGNPDELEWLLTQLESVPKVPRPALNAYFDTPHAYVYGLCAIATWGMAHARRVDIQSKYPRVMHFVERAGVLEAMRNPTSDPVRFDTETILGFTRVDPGSTFQTDAHAGRLVDLFRRHSELDEGACRSLSIAFAELIENAVKHGEIQSPAWLFANYHPGPHILHVCICDRGIGVQQTFKQSSNERLRTLAEHPTAWLAEATKPLVTSKSEGHAGYGLHITKELCRRNGGRFTIVSGQVAYQLRPQSPDAAHAEVEETRILSKPWRGTLLALQFRFDRPLEIGPIYAALPAPDGSEEDIPDVNLFDD